MQGVFLGWREFVGVEVGSDDPWVPFPALLTVCGPQWNELKTTLVPGCRDIWSVCWEAHRGGGHRIALVSGSGKGVTEHVDSAQPLASTGRLRGSCPEAPCWSLRQATSAIMVTQSSCLYQPSES